MTLQISLSSEAERRLRERAAAAGQDPAVFVARLVEVELAAEEAAEPGPKASTDQRIAELNAWAAMNPPLPCEADDNREAIYKGPGE